MEGKEGENLPRLSYEEVARFNDKKNDLKRQHEKYLNKHPEIKHLIGDFTSALLLEKPDDIFAYASSHFRSQAPFGSGTTCRPLVIAGSTGAGKRSLIEDLLKNYSTLLNRVISHTTREKRKEEKNGVDYHFVESEVFAHMSKNNEFVEEDSVEGTSNHYGTTFEAFLDAQGGAEAPKTSFRVPVAIMSVAGVAKLKENKAFAPYFVYIKAPSEAELKRRLAEKHAYKEDRIEQEILRAAADDEYGETSGNFHEVICNDEFDVASDHLKRLVEQ